MKFRCDRCQILFRKPTANAVVRAEKTLCYCGRPFWHGGQASEKQGVVYCYAEPEEHEELTVWK